MAAFAGGLARGIGTQLQKQQEDTEASDERQRGREQQFFASLLNSTDSKIRDAAVSGLNSPIRRTGRDVFTGLPLTNPAVTAIMKRMKDTGQALGPESAAALAGKTGPTGTPPPEVHTGLPGEGTSLPTAPGGVQQTAPTVTGAPSPVKAPSIAPSAAQPATAITGTNAPPPPAPAWQQAPNAQGTTPPPAPAAAPPSSTGASGLMGPVEQAALRSKEAGDTAGAELTGRLNALRGPNGQMDPETQRLATELGILKIPPPPAFEGVVAGASIPAEERTAIPDFSETQNYRRTLDRVTQKPTYWPVTPTSLQHGELRALANPARQGAPSYFYVYQDGRPMKYVGDVSEKEQNVTITHGPGDQELIRIPPRYLMQSGQPGTPHVAQPEASTTAPPQPTAQPSTQPTSAAPAPAPGSASGAAAQGAGTAGPPQPPARSAATAASSAPPPATAPRRGLVTKEPQDKLQDVFTWDNEGNIRAEKAWNHEGGPFISPLTGQAMNNVVMRKLSDGDITTLATSKSTINLIDQALASLEKIKTDNTLQGTLDYAKPYLSGRGGTDPLVTARAGLENLAALQASNTPGLAGRSRAMSYVISTQAHLPILPTPRDVTLAIGPRSTQAIDIARRVGPEHLGGNQPSWDSPASAYGKLVTARDRLLHWREEVLGELGKPRSGDTQPSIIRMRAPDGRELAVPVGDADRILKTPDATGRFPTVIGNAAPAGR